MSEFMDWVNELNDQNLFNVDGTINVAAIAPVKEKTKYIPPEIVSKLEKRGEFTLDFSSIRRQRFIPVFIYQHELLSNGKHSDILIPSESKFLGKAYSTMPHFTLYDIGEEMPRRTMAFVNTSPNGNSLLKGSCLQGEVFALTPEALLNLDRYMQNTEESDRMEKTFTLIQQDSPFKGNPFPTIKCWVHLGHEPFFDKIKMVKRPVTQDVTLRKWFFIP